MAAMPGRPPVIIEAAINGNTPKRSNPHVPRTPAEIAACGLECLDRGAAIVHNHNDEPNVGGPARHDPAPYAEAWTRDPGAPARCAPAPDGARHVARRADRGALLAPRRALRRRAAADGIGRPGHRGHRVVRLRQLRRRRRLHVRVVPAATTCRCTSRSSSRASCGRCSRGCQAGTLPDRVKIQLYFGAAAPFGLPPTTASLDGVPGHARRHRPAVDGGRDRWRRGGERVGGGGIEARRPRAGRAGGPPGSGAGRNEDLVTEAVALVRGAGRRGGHLRAGGRPAGALARTLQ